MPCAKQQLISSHVALHKVSDVILLHSVVIFHSAIILLYTIVSVKSTVFDFSIVELAPFGVRVNAVSPGALKSHFNMRFGDIFTKQEQLETVSRLQCFDE